MPLVIYGLEGVHDTQTHTYPHETDFKKSDALACDWCVSGLKINSIQITRI